MSHKLLVFESDPEFAHEVEATFRRHGAVVRVVGDGTEGPELVEAEKPDVILISVQLPTVNGWMVCKLIKKRSELKHIPVVILSSDADAENTFEQHRKLRTHAEDYIQKPISVGELVRRVRAFVALEEPDDGGVDEEIEAFAESAFDSLTSSASVAPAAAAADPDVDTGEHYSDVLELDDQAFSEAEEMSSEASQPGAAAWRENDHRDIGRETLDAELEALSGNPSDAYTAAAAVGDAGAERASARDADGLAARLGEAERARQRAEERVRELEMAAAEVDGGVLERRALEERVHELEGKLAAASLPPERVSQSPGRDVLDLKQQLNAKDKDLLNLRDELSTSEKRLLELRDANLVLERGNAEYEDHVRELERQLSESQQALDNAAKNRAALEENIQASKKREQDLKQRIERGQAQLETMEAEKQEALRAVQAQHAEEMTRRSETHAAELQSTAEAQLRELAALRAELERERDDALAESDARRQSEHRTAMETLTRDLQATHEQATAALRESLTAAQEDALAEQEDANARELAVLGRKLAEAESELAEKTNLFAALSQQVAQLQADLEHRTKERNGLQTDVRQSRERIESLERSLQEQRQQIESLERKGSQLEEQLSKAQRKFSADGEILTKARRALEIATVLLEDQAKGELG